MTWAGRGHVCALVPGTRLCSLSAVASDRTTWPDSTEWSERPKRLPRRATDFFRLDRFPSAAEHGTANAGGGERLTAQRDHALLRASATRPSRTATASRSSTNRTYAVDPPKSAGSHRAPPSRSAETTSCTLVGRAVAYPRPGSRRCRPCLPVLTGTLWARTPPAAVPYAHATLAPCGPHRLSGWSAGSSPLRGCGARPRPQAWSQGTATEPLGGARPGKT
jgi:hypothetical protein